MDHFGPREATTQDLTRGPKAPALRVHVHSNADGGSRNIEQQGREKVKNKTRWCMRGGGRAGDPEAKVAVT
jgi:hypothetical protein